MLWGLGVLAAPISAAYAIGIVVGKFREDKRKEYVRRAELKRAREINE